ncbi:MAG: SUMF1/EgtB/PvdO family nonheme iron enzyme [Mariniphaga sp.]
MNTRYLLPFLLLLSFSGILFAQPQISVKSFEKRENDITARIEAPKKDQNGDLCAIIKVVTTQTGFIWDSDALGIISADYKTGEYWIYVPYGAKRLTIKHEKLGILRDYMYPVPIEKAGVYIMELTTGKVTTTVEDEQIASQWLVINSDPTGSDIYIDDEPANQTPYQNELPVGKHTYNLSHDFYLPTAGIVDLKPDKKEVLNLTLKPNFGKLTITTTPETSATVSLDDVATGKTTPCVLEQLKAGEHTVTIRLNMYQTVTQKIIIQPGSEIKQPVTLIPTFAGVKINTNPASDIFISGELKGNGTWTGPLLPGVYTFEARKEKYTTAKEKRKVTMGQPLTINLQPVPKTGGLKIITTPPEATISIDGEIKGTSPATLRNLFAGDHALTLSLAGYATTFKNITISEGETARVTETLVNGRAVNINSEPAGSMLFIDGQSVGQTPYSGSLTFGNHILRIQQGDKKVEKSVSISQVGGETTFSLSFVSQSPSGNVNSTIIEMVTIKGGTFQMGSKESRDEQPIHSVTLNGFNIGKTEVTQAQWKSIMGSNPGNFKSDNLPVENVSWDDVQVFIGKLNAKSGKSYRLPTEAEWEYAAGKIDETSLGDYAWYDVNSNKTTHPVGTKQPNQFGLYDMGGNVWEWCNDWYEADSYSKSQPENPKGPSAGSSRVRRGGSWLDSASYSRSTFRGNASPVLRSYTSGFRLVLDL